MEDDRDDQINQRFQDLISKLKCLKETDADTLDIHSAVREFQAELPKLKPMLLVESVEFCEELIRDQESPFIVWKDLLPQTVENIIKLPNITVNGILLSGGEYRRKILDSLTTLKWKKEIVIPLAEMFREMRLIKEERETVTRKLCDALPSVVPSEVPSLAYQLFSLCKDPNLLIMPILSLQKYFNTFFYQKLFNDLHSNTTDYDGIEMHSDKEMSNFEETVLYHLNNMTVYSMTEMEIVTAFRVLSGTPNYILTPFVTTALLTVTNINRHIDMNRLSLSKVLPFFRSVIKNAEKEKQMAKESSWCRSTFNRDFVNIEKLFEILFEQSQIGMDVVTPGFVGLLFILLKSKNQPDLHILAINLLQKFLKKRQHFGRGIVKHLLDFLLANFDAPQLTECMNTLSVTSKLAVSECLDSLKNVLDFLLTIPGLQAMRIVSFFFPLIPVSYLTRDYLIDTLRKAMFSNNEWTRTFGIYGFCKLLRHLKNSNSRRIGTSIGGTGIMTQVSISGFSMMSQSTLGNKSNPFRDFDMLSMEILGILRKVFDESVQMKVVLYETLLKAVDQNYILAPHVLFFIDYHFKNYFEIDQLTFKIKFSDFIMETDGKIEIWDNLGHLIYFVGFCVLKCEKYEQNYDTKIMKDLLESLINRIGNVTLDSLEITGSPCPHSMTIGTHFLYCLEGVMAYCALAATPNNQYLDKIEAIFDNYQKCSKTLKEMWENIKKLTSKKGKKANATKSAIMTQQMTQIPQFAPGKRVNIWDLATIERFLIVIYEKAGIFGSTQQINAVRENREFHCHVLRIARDCIKDFPTQPDYKYVTNSRQLFVLLCSCSKILYENCVKKLFSVMERFDVEAGTLGVEAFKHCLMTTEAVYKRKLSEFLCFVTKENQSVSDNVAILVQDIQDLLIKCMDESALIDIDSNSRQIPGFLLSCLEILYDHVPAEKSQAFQWLEKFCQSYSIVGKNLDNIHKMLFQQSIKVDEGLFFNSVASQLSDVIGSLGVGLENPPPSTAFKSIEEETAESCMVQLLNALRKEITDVEYMITKVKSMLGKLKIMVRTKSDEHIEPLISMERAICMHLLKIANCILILSNVKVRLGAPVENLFRVIISFYGTTNALTKHLTARHPSISVNFNQLRFDKLVKVTGGSLAKSCYQLVKYIYDQLAPESKETSSKVKESKAVVVRNLRYNSTLVKEMENFDKCVRILGRKVKNNSLEKFLYADCVRDFRIKDDKLKNAISEDFFTPMGSDEDEDDDIVDDSSEEDQSSLASTGSSGGSTVEDTVPESDPEEAIRRNVRRVNEQSKRNFSESDKEDESPNKRPGRKAKAPLKLNKRAAEIVVKPGPSSRTPLAKKSRKS
ncbi:Fanconi anemia group I protein [Sergentomyia squamirostris]